MIDYTLLRKLCAADGISGDEGEVRDLIINEIKDCADEIRIDNLGNILVHKKGRARAVNKLMLSAHMDEVGLLVTDVTSDGYLKIDEVGGIDRRVLVGKRVYVGKNGSRRYRRKARSILPNGDEKTRQSRVFSEMYIDIGATAAMMP